MNKQELIKLLKRVSLVGLLFLAAGIVISAVENRDASRITGLSIEIQPLETGNWLIQPADVMLTLDRSFGFQLEGAPLKAVNIGRMERVLEEDPFILNADVYVDASNGIHIELNQRQPILRIIDNNEGNYYLDGAGHSMPQSKHFTARVLVATGNIPPHTPDFLVRKKHPLKDLYELAKILLEDPFYNALVEQIYVSNVGEYILIPKVGQQKIILGPFEDLDDKLERLKIFYKQGVPYEGWRKYKTINLKFKDQVVCKKR